MVSQISNILKALAIRPTKHVILGRTLSFKGLFELVRTPAIA